MPHQIIHLDDHLLVINKPAGMATIAEGWNNAASDLRSQLEAEFGRLWTIHRLDKVTSGVLLFARNATAHRALNQLFETREVHKTYHAVLCGIPSWKETTTRQPLRVNVGHSHRTVVDWKRGVQAVTEFRLCEIFTAHALVEIIPLTGRTHQIRAHASSLGHPILADSLYGAAPTDLITRPALHAYSLDLKYQGSPFSFIATYPQDLMDVLERLRAG